MASDPGCGMVAGRDENDNLIITSLVELAHQHGLVVHPYTFRADALPDHFRTFEEALTTFVVQAQIDGLFTDFPDRAVKLLDTLPAR